MNSFHPVAITGIGGIFPGAFDMKSFWENVRRGLSQNREVPDNRWSVPKQFVCSSRNIPDKAYSSRGCFIDDFSISQLIDFDKYHIDESFVRELDPLYHVLLIAGIMAYEDAGVSGINKEKTGLIVGNIALPTHGTSSISEQILGRTFEEMVLGKSEKLPEKSVHPINRYVTGMPAGILAKVLGLNGGSFALDAACASSLYAVKLAADELISGRADVMLSGGMSRPDCLYTQMGFSQLGALSPDGICSPFDSKANGLVMGEGAGIVVMKRLEDALKAGDKIYGIITGIGTSNDRSGNLLAPDIEGQIRSMKSAYEKAEWSPNDIDLVECHGTGTPVGDVVEFNSLRALWQDQEWKNGQCVIGSVKSNIGHLLTGAGAAGLIKVLLAMKEKTLPPTARFESPNPNIDFNESPFRVLKKAEPWEKRDENTPRRAAVSAFGFGGINAHVLVEEWEDREEVKKKYLSIPPLEKKKCDIAVVGMESHFGTWKNLESFRKRIFEEESSVEPEVKKLWFGVENAEWIKEEFSEGVDFRGYSLDELDAAIGEFKIPPRELQQMLPQQVLMLKTAASALSSSGNKDRDHERSGTYIGIGFDFNTTNYHYRWLIHEKIKEWAEKLSLNLDDSQISDWKEKLQKAVCPELNADRVMGALGSIVASRISREFSFGGPSFAVSSEESSAFRALETAVKLLKQGDIDLGVVGAVDLAADIRSLLSAEKLRGEPLPIFGEGAGALILKRLEDAEKDGDKIYAVISGFGTASGGETTSLSPRKEAYRTALERAYGYSGIEPADIDHIELAGSGFPEEDRMEGEIIREFFGENRSKVCSVGTMQRSIGNTGAASGIASLMKACLCLHHRTLPAFSENEDIFEQSLKEEDNFYIPHHPQYWLRNRVEGPRRAAVSAFSADGNCAHVILEAYEKEMPVEPVVTPGEAIFAVEGKDASSIIERIEMLKKFVQDTPDSEIFQLGASWLRNNPCDPTNPLAAAFVAGGRQELLKQLKQAVDSLREDPNRDFQKNGNLFTTGFDSASVFYCPNPVEMKGKLAFIYSGSGNHFPGMGREIGLCFPDIMERQDRENDFLRSQVIPQHFWNRESTVELNNDHRTIIGGQVILGTIVSDLLAALHVNPDASIGYSLGESSALFGLRVWKDRDLMLKNMLSSTLYGSDLASPYNAARKAWNLKDNEKVDWFIALVNIPASRVREVIRGREKVYLLIVNTPEECILGGEREPVLQLIKDLNCDHLPLPGVTIAHCDVVSQVAKKYRDFHIFDVTKPEGIDFYSCGWGRKYDVTTDSAADAILDQCLHELDYPHVINLAYEDGVRNFIEIGPGNSNTRMNKRILAGKNHFAASACYSGKGEISQILRILAQLIAFRIPVNLEYFYKWAKTGDEEEVKGKLKGKVHFTVGGKPYIIPEPGTSEKPEPVIIHPRPAAVKPAVLKKTPVSMSDFTCEGAEDITGICQSMESSAQLAQSPCYVRETTSVISETGAVNSSRISLLKRFEEAQMATSRAHDAYLRFSRNLTGVLTENMSSQMSLLTGQNTGTMTMPDMSFMNREPSVPVIQPYVKTGGNGNGNDNGNGNGNGKGNGTGVKPRLSTQVPQVLPKIKKAPPVPAVKPAISQIKKVEVPPQISQAPIVKKAIREEAVPSEPPRSLDREQCMEYAIGKIGSVLGSFYAEVDSYPTRVRLPDEPLMLVDRITHIEGEPGSLTTGRVITEHDVLPDSWYLDAGKIPTCIAVEAGQADLFLSGFLGIDLKTEGKAVYRLLDATVTFHDVMPRPGETIIYDIRILRFFKQGSTYLFKFQFDATVNGKSFLTMRDGCAGFFTNEELDAGQGIVHTSLDLMPMEGVKSDDWEELVPVGIECYSDEQLDALRAGDLAGCYGPEFEGLPFVKPLTLPGGKMKLVDRVLHIDPNGGRFGMGLIRAEADIHPDDWFLTCHFCDDNVMPGTLMYECCMHTMRIMLMRMGWIAENDGNHAWEPIPGVQGSLKCRGQVIASTKKAAYEISLKEVGYDEETGEPYAIADALMFADGRMVVEMTDMSMKLSGANREELSEIWHKQQERSIALRGKCIEKEGIFKFEDILAFAVGKPSEAFGEPYRIFDEERIIARLPGPPYQFLDRIIDINAPQWVMEEGGTVTAQYDVPANEWYFDANRQNHMPFAILLEIALQPCGWLAAYMGSALYSDTDLSFRNLGGSAVMFHPVKRNAGTLTIDVKVTGVSSSGGMIIQNYEFEVFQHDVSIYKGTTYFGFFSKEALANQVGIRNPGIYKPSSEELERGRKFVYPGEYPFPDEHLKMIDQVEIYIPDGGPHGLGFIQGTMDVDPSVWFFKAHFYQDPVIPGSLGLESMLQLMKVVAIDRWGVDPDRILLTTPPGMKHNWIYRGQVIPRNRKVTVDAWITSVDDENGVMFADGFLSVDGITIYQMNDFSLRMWTDR